MKQQNYLKFVFSPNALSSRAFPVRLCFNCECPEQRSDGQAALNRWGTEPENLLRQIYVLQADCLQELRSELVLGRGAGGTEGHSALWLEPQPETERVQRRLLVSSLTSSGFQ